MELSSKRGPRMDEDLKKPTRGGEDAKHPESGLGPNISTRRRFRLGGAPGRLSPTKRA